MSSIEVAVFQATFGLLIDKARDKAAEKLKEGDVTDEKFRSMIVRKIDHIDSKLDGLARKDLLSSISVFKEGIDLLFDVIKQANSGVKEMRGDATGKEDAATTAGETVFLAKKLANVQTFDLDESCIELLSVAKKRFEEARKEARGAFCNEGLNILDRILAMMIRVMSTILEKVDNTTHALSTCRRCLEELHALPAVKKSFKTALAKGSWKSRFSKDERKEIIAAVCDINHAIFDVTLISGSNVLIWPLIDVEAERIHPLRDPRVAEIAKESTQYIGCYPMQWTFGVDIIKDSRGICTTTEGQFIVGDNRENIKVFDSDHGNFLRSMEIESFTNICDLATDNDDNVYVLFQVDSEYKVCIFDKDNNMPFCFVVYGFKKASHLTVEKNSKQISVLGKQKGSISNFVVNVYEANGICARSFPADHRDEPEGFVPQVIGITANNKTNDNKTKDQIDGRVMVLYNSQVYLFSQEGNCQHKFTSTVSQETETNRTKSMQVKAQNIMWTNEHVIVVSICADPVRSFYSADLDVSIFTEDGKLLYRFPISSCYQHLLISGITINRQGRIALALSGLGKSEILVF